MKASPSLPANYVTLRQLKERREEEERLRKLKEEEERLRKLKEEGEEEQERPRKLKEEEEETIRRKNRNQNQRRDELRRPRGGTPRPDKPCRGRAPGSHHRSRPGIAAADPDSNPEAAAGAPVSEPTKSQVPAKRGDIPIADEATGLEDAKVAADRVEGKKKKYRRDWKKNFKKKTKGISTAASADEPSPEIQAGDGCESCLAVEAVESGPEKAPPPAMRGRFKGEYRPVRVSRGEVDRTAEIERKIGYLTVRGVGGAGREGERRSWTVGMNPRGSGFGCQGGGGGGMMWVRKSTES